MRPIISMRAAISDPDLLYPVLGAESWAAWRALLTAAMGEPLTDEERAIFRQLTEREREPLRRVEDLWVVAGRRGGKSRAIAALIVYLATMVDYSGKLAIGERGVVQVLASNVKQAHVVFGYVAGILESTPALAKLVENKTSETNSLESGIEIEIRAATFRGLRGVTAVAAVCDEIAFWQADDGSSKNPDGEILAAIRPSLATTNGILVCLGSPYARRGEMWRMYRQHYGAAGDELVLVAQGTSRDLNPTLPQSVIDRAMERDVEAARAEYLAEFRRDLEDYVSQEVIDAVTAAGGTNCRLFLKKTTSPLLIPPAGRAIVLP
jgi:hypothetical protein